MKHKIPFQVLFLEFLAVLVDKRTASVDYLEVGNVAKTAEQKFSIWFDDVVFKLTETMCSTC